MSARISPSAPERLVAIRWHGRGLVGAGAGQPVAPHRRRLGGWHSFAETVKRAIRARGFAFRPADRDEAVRVIGYPMLLAAARKRRLLERRDETVEEAKSRAAEEVHRWLQRQLAAGVLRVERTPRGAAYWYPSGTDLPRRLSNKNV